MEAKDTLMTLDEARLICSKAYKDVLGDFISPHHIDMTCVPALLHSQAKISFKAGQVSIVDKENFNYKRGFLAAFELIQAKQDEKTASIAYKQGYDDACRVKGAECQARIALLFKETEEHHLFEHWGIGSSEVSVELEGLKWWQDLKKRGGIK